MKHMNVISGSELLGLATEEILNPPRGISLQTWPKFTNFTGGLRLHEFTIFCGATGAGKTQWLANLIAQLIDEDHKVFAVPVETGHTDLTKRVLTVYGKHDFNIGDDPTADMRSDLMRVLKGKMEKIQSNLFMSTHDNRIPVQEMIATLEFMVKAHGIKVAVLDNLNFFLKPSRDMNLEYDNAVHEFVMTAKRLPIHIFLVMHPRKTDEGKILSEFDIKGSSTAVQEASNVLLMNRLTEKELKDMEYLTPMHREFVFRKIRKRGIFVGRKFYMEYQNGKYTEHGFKPAQPAAANIRSAKTSGPWNRVVDDKDEPSL